MLKKKQSVLYKTTSTTVQKQDILMPLNVSENYCGLEIYIYMYIYIYIYFFFFFFILKKKKF